MSLINCEVELDLSWSKDCLIPEIPANPTDNPPTDRTLPTQISKATFQINNVKLYDPVVTLSINDNIKFLENINFPLC